MTFHSVYNATLCLNSESVRRMYSIQNILPYKSVISATLVGIPFEMMILIVTIICSI